MKRYTKPAIRVQPLALQQMLCGSLLGVNSKEVEKYEGDGEEPDNWGCIW